MEIAQNYVKAHKVNGIRISTRPDYINGDAVSLLKQYGVTAIEIGAQSMDDEVLRLSGRGHTAEDVVKAAAIIKRTGISLGVQMMLGLPGDTLDKTVETTRRLASLGAETARVYPALVIKSTMLERMYQANEYTPLSLDDAVEWSSYVLQIFEENDINVIRVGLHPSEGLLSGDSLAAGPFHVSFRELVLSRIWKKFLEPLLYSEKNKEIIIYVTPEEYNYAVGYEASNKKMLLKKFQKVVFEKDPSIKSRYYRSMCS